MSSVAGRFLQIPRRALWHSLFHFIIPWKLAMPGFMSSNSPSRCSLTLKWMSGKVARNFYVMISGWDLFCLGIFCYQGAPARGASLKLFDENGHVQKCVIDAGRYGPLDKCSLWIVCEGSSFGLLNLDVPISGAFREICTTFVNELKSILMVLFKLLQKRWKWIETGCHELWM